MARQATLVLLVWGIVTSLLEAQSVDKSRVRPDSGVEITSLPQLYETLDFAFIAYARSASMRDERTGKVTGQSVKVFKSLFAFNAKVYDDMAVESPDMINYSDYASKVFNQADHVGVLYELGAATLLSLRYDPGGFYHAEIGVDKILKHGLDTKNRLHNYPAPGRCMSLVLEYDIAVGQLDKAEIMNIRGKPCDETTPAPSISTGKPWCIALRAQSGALWYNLKPSERAESLNMRPTQTAWAIVGAEIRYAMDEQQKLQLGLGAGIASWRTGLEVNGNYCLDMSGNVDTCGNGKQITLKDFNETVTLQGLELSLSLHINVLQKNKIALSARAGVGTLIRAVSIKEFRSGMQTVNTIPEKIDTPLELPSPALRKIIPSAHFGGLVRYDLISQLSLELGIETAVSLQGAFLQKKDATMPFFLDTSGGIQTQKTFFDTYLEKMHLNRWGISLGVIYKL